MVEITSLERRKRERERKSNEIIDVAEEIFSLKGFNKTTMDDIAAELELTKPALYRYFQSKEDLYFAVVLRGTNILDKMMTEAVDSKKTGLEKIFATGVAFCKFYQRYPDYCRLMIYARNLFSECTDCMNLRKLSKHGKNHLEIMCDAIETGKADGTIRIDIDTFMTAIYLVEATSAIMQLSENIDDAMETQGKSNQDFIEHSLNLMRHSLENQEGDV